MSETLDRGGGRSAAGWLGLAAAPSFAIMALLTGLLGGKTAMICGAAHEPLGGMVPMYLLMCAFHSAPWLKLIGARAIEDRDKRNGA